MSYYDPPNPPEALHPCRNCDSEMDKEWPCRDSEYICTNPDCKNSPYYCVRISQTRDFTIRFFRHEHAPNEVEIVRNGVSRIYSNVNEKRITALHHIVKGNKIETSADFYLYTEISFQCDYEP